MASLWLSANILRIFTPSSALPNKALSLSYFNMQSLAGFESGGLVWSEKYE